MARGNRTDTLAVWLEPSSETAIFIGTLTRDPTGRIQFDVSQSYIDLGPQRPVFSSAWRHRDDEEVTKARLLERSDKIAAGGLLPAWFSNLLPEGALRTLVDMQLGTGRHDEFDALAILGLDLPGAVVVRDTEGLHQQLSPSQVAGKRSLFSGGAVTTPRIGFSLAGVELKFSMEYAEDKLTVPGGDGFGHIIAKLPNRKHPFMPEIEYSSMRLAAAAGVTAATCRLVPIGSVDGLPAEWIRHGRYVLAVDRFDRVPGSMHRHHTEDFAQIVGARDDRKYTMANTETMMKIGGRFSDDTRGAILEGARRVVVDVMLGNTDDHMKNWSILYDGPEARLSPAYDIFAWYVYDRSNAMALPFQGTKSSDIIALNRFQRIATHLGIDERALVREVTDTVERACDTWPKLLEDLPIPEEHIDTLRSRWERLALTKEAGRNAFETLRPTAVVREAGPLREGAAPSIDVPPHPASSHKAFLSRDGATVRIKEWDHEKESYYKVGNTLGPAVVTKDSEVYMIGGQKLSKEAWENHPDVIANREPQLEAAQP